MRRVFRGIPCAALAQIRCNTKRPPTPKAHPTTGKPYGLATLAVHAGEATCPFTGAVDTPIYQSSTYAAETADEASALFGEEKPGYVYTRLGNPTIRCLQEKCAAIEGAEAGLAFGSGMAAVSSTILSIVKTGDHIVTATSVYGATFGFLKTKMPRMGVDVSFVAEPSVDAFEKAIKPNTKLIYFETPSNPSLDIIDIAAMTKLAKSRGIMTIVDNTFASPVLQNPYKLGADVVIHSLTKYLGGHGDAVGGVAVGSEKYIWHLDHDIIRDYGGIISPFNAWLVLRGIRTLHLRVMSQCQSAKKIAEWLSKHPKISKVSYPGLPTHPGHEIAKRQMKDFGAMISFEGKGGYEAGKKLLDRVKLFANAVSLGDVRSLIEHPASTSHRSVPAAEKLATGITEGLVRVSVGAETVEDLMEDIDQGLK